MAHNNKILNETNYNDNNNNINNNNINNNYNNTKKKMLYNCRKKTFPVNNKCLLSNLIYRAAVKTNNSYKIYVGSTGNTFKE